MSPTFKAAFGLDIVERAQARSKAYHQGLDDAMDGKPLVVHYDEARLHIAYYRGYRDGRAQLATYTPDQNPYTRR